MLNKEQIVTYFQSLQDNICAALEKADGKGKFIEDQWDRPGGGGGRARVIHGQTLEKGGVNFSAVHGELPENIIAKLGVETGNFFASKATFQLCQQESSSVSLPNPAKNMANERGHLSNPFSYGSGHESHCHREGKS